MSIRDLFKPIAAVLLIGGAMSLSSGALAQTTRAGARPSSVLPTGGGQALLDPSDAVLLLLDHQTGLFQTVKDVPIDDLRRNTVMLAKLATLFNIPIITTASEPNGPNGPLMPELDEAAPRAIYVPRKGEVNAWDNADFVAAVRKTGRNTLIMAGVWTSVCVMFPALDAKAAGFKVYTVPDASGDPSLLASSTSIARFAGRHRANRDKCSTRRSSSDVEPPRGRRAREAVRAGFTSLRGRGGELSESSGGGPTNRVTAR